LKSFSLKIIKNKGYVGKNIIRKNVLKRKVRKSIKPNNEVGGIPKITVILIIFKRTRKNERTEIKKITKLILDFIVNRSLLNFMPILLILIYF